MKNIDFCRESIMILSYEEENILISIEKVLAFV